jgi:hypothetical protein
MLLLYYCSYYLLANIYLLNLSEDSFTFIFLTEVNRETPTYLFFDFFIPGLFKFAHMGSRTQTWWMLLRCSNQS